MTATTDSAPQLQQLKTKPIPPVTLRRAWLVRAALLPGKCLHTAISISTLAGADGGATVVLRPQTLEKFGVSRDACYDALTRLTEEGLITVIRRRGRSPKVTLQCL